MERAASKLKPRTAVSFKEKDEQTVYLRNIFGFMPQDVEGIHTYKVDEGSGVWFRLKDGRVFNQHGAPAAPDHALYRPHAHGHASR